jgi:hypothetical protein
MTLYRWRNDPRLNFPQPDLSIHGRDHWSDALLAAFDRSHAEAVE